MNWPARMVMAGICVLVGLAELRAAEPWQPILSAMPLRTNVAVLDRNNCVPLMLHAFCSNQTVKALIFMPGATDEFYMFRRARAALTNTSPSLLDAVVALTNHTLIRVTYQPPFLLLHTDEDPLDPLIRIEHEATTERIKKVKFPATVWFDRDWEAVQPILKKNLKVDVRPWRYTYDSWHFYRHSLAGFGLNGWEAMEAVMLAGKTTVNIARKRLVFEGDERVRATPKVESFPR
jgi:hypothetical protein